MLNVIRHYAIMGQLLLLMLRPEYSKTRSTPRLLMPPLFASTHHQAQYVYQVHQLTTVECRYNTVQYSAIFYTALHWLKQNINQCQITNYTPYLALTGELWGVFWEDLIENWPHYKGTALYVSLMAPSLPCGRISNAYQSIPFQWREII